MLVNDSQDGLDVCMRDGCVHVQLCMRAAPGVWCECVKAVIDCVCVGVRECVCMCIRVSWHGYQNIQCYVPVCIYGFSRLL